MYSSFLLSSLPIGRWMTWLEQSLGLWDRFGNWGPTWRIKKIESLGPDKWNITIILNFLSFSAESNSSFFACVKEVVCIILRKQCDPQANWWNSSNLPLMPLLLLDLFLLFPCSFFCLMPSLCQCLPRVPFKPRWTRAWTSLYILFWLLSSSRAPMRPVLSSKGWEMVWLFVCRGKRGVQGWGWKIKYSKRISNDIISGTVKLLGGEMLLNSEIFQVFIN